MLGDVFYQILCMVFLYFDVLLEVADEGLVFIDRVVHSVQYTFIHTYQNLAKQGGLVPPVILPGFLLDKALLHIFPKLMFIIYFLLVYMLLFLIASCF